jgi:hypothetical protein
VPAHDSSDTLIARLDHLALPEATRRVIATWLRDPNYSDARSEL